MRRLIFSVAALLLAATALAQTQETEDAIYRLNVGDEIAVTVVGEPDLSETLRIDGQGSINQKFLGLLQVAGLTVTEAERLLEQQLIAQKFLRSPVVRMKLTSYAQRSVVVFGSVNQPGVVMFPPEIAGMDILDVIAKCGGFNTAARRTNVRVKRRTAEGTDEVLSVNVRNMMSGRDPSSFSVLPGDVITVD